MLKKLIFGALAVFVIFLIGCTYISSIFFDPPLPASEELSCRVSFVDIRKIGYTAGQPDTCITVQVTYDVGSRILSVNPGEPTIYTDDGRQFIAFPGGTGADGKVHFDISQKTNLRTNAIVIEYRFSLASVFKNPGAAVFQTDVTVASASERRDLPVTLAMGGLDREGELLPPGAVARLGSNRFELPQPPTAAIYAPDGKKLYSAAQTIHCFDAARGTVLDRYYLDGVRQIKKLAISPKGDFLAAVTLSGVRLIDLKTGRPCAMLRGETVADAIAFSPKDELFATTTKTGTVNIWFTGNWRKYRSIIAEEFFTEKEDPIVSVEFSPSGKVIAVAGKRSVQLINVDDSTVLDKWLFESRPICTFQPDSTLLWIYADNTLLQRDYIARKEEKIELSEKPVAVDRLEFLPDGCTMVGGVGDKLVLIDSVTGMPGEVALPGRFLCASPGGKTAVTAGQSRLDLVEVTTGKTLFSRHADTIRDFGFSYDGRSIVSTDGKFIYQWDVANGRCVNRVVPPHPPRFARFLAEHTGIAWYDESSLLNLKTGGEVPLPEDYKTAGPRLADFERTDADAVSPDGYLTARKRSNAILISQNSRRDAKTIATYGPVTAMAFSSDSSLCAAANLQGGIIYDAMTKEDKPFKLPHIAGDLGGAVEQLGFSLQGDTLAVNDGMHVFLIDPKTGDIFFICETDVDVITEFRFSRDGNRLVTDSQGGCLLVWDLTVARQLMNTLARRAGTTPYWLPVSVPENFRSIITEKKSKTRIRSHLINEKVQKMW